MAKRSKAKIFQPAQKGHQEATKSVEIPDEALTYIVANFLRQKNKDGMPVVIGVSSHTVEAVLQLLVDWAMLNGYVKDGVMVLGNQTEQ